MLLESLQKLLVGIPLEFLLGYLRYLKLEIVLQFLLEMLESLQQEFVLKFWQEYLKKKTMRSSQESILAEILGRITGEISRGISLQIHGIYLGILRKKKNLEEFLDVFSKIPPEILH